MVHLAADLKVLIGKAKSQGFLTYDQVNEYLPNEAVTPEKLTVFWCALEEMGIELVTEDPTEVKSINNKGNDSEEQLALLPKERGQNSATIRSACI